MFRESPPPQRQSIRLPFYDYRRQGAYFVTICTLNREPFFGKMVGDTVHLSEGGHIARKEWLRSSEMRHQIELDAFVIMPNHVHGIIVIRATGDERLDGKPQTASATEGRGGIGEASSGAAGVGGTPLRGPGGRSLGAIVGGYKAAVTRRMTAARLVTGASVWQRNYYEHVIRNEDDLARIRQYIADNPANWALDRENPAHHP